MFSSKHLLNANYFLKIRVFLLVGKMLMSKQLFNTQYIPKNKIFTIGRNTCTQKVRFLEALASLEEGMSVTQSVSHSVTHTFVQFHI